MYITGLLFKSGGEIEEMTPKSLGKAAAVGLLILGGGVFLSLAAHGILPQGINAISKLGVWGQVIGYGLGGVGALIVFDTAFHIVVPQLRANKPSEPKEEKKGTAAKPPH